MKRFTCEICGSSDLIKDEGVFACQVCGCKYTVEEVKRMMMVEATDAKDKAVQNDDSGSMADATGKAVQNDNSGFMVDASGSTVQIDNSAFVEKYLANARRAKNKEDWEETEKYYNMVEQNDPDNIEAIFYSAFAKAKVSLNDEDIYKRGATFNVLKNCVSVIDEHYTIDRRDENKKAIIEMGQDLGDMLCSGFVFTEWKNEYGSVVKTNKSETINMFRSLLYAFRESIDNIKKIDDQGYLHSTVYKLYQVARATGYWEYVVIDKWIEEEYLILLKFAEKYWEEHPEEKEALENEILDLENKIEDTKKQIESLEFNEIELLSEELEIEKKKFSEISIFKRKEMKEASKKVEIVQSRLKDAENARDETIQKYNDKIQEYELEIFRIRNEIQLHLTENL